MDFIAGSSFEKKITVLVKKIGKFTTILLEKLGYRFTVIVCPNHLIDFLWHPREGCKFRKKFCILFHYFHRTKREFICGEEAEGRWEVLNYLKTKTIAFML